MAEIRAFSPEFADGVLRLLGGLDASPMARPRWERLLAYAAPGSDHPSGYVLLANNLVVGFLGTLHSERRIRGGNQLLCNLSSWIVDESHRAAGLGLLRKALQSRHVTITNFTASDQVTVILKHLGFRALDDTGYFVSLGHGLVPGATPVRIASRREEIAPLLDDECAPFFRDHGYPHCQHLHVTTADGPCYVLYTMRRKRRVWPYAHLHFISNRRAFSLASASIVRHLAKRHGSLGLLLEGRFLDPDLRPRFFVHPVPLRRLYRSSSLEPGDIDHLYTELPVLGL
jgi:hypothetical protein